MPSISNRAEELPPLPVCGRLPGVGTGEGTGEAVGLPATISKIASAVLLAGLSPGLVVVTTAVLRTCPGCAVALTRVTMRIVMTSPGKTVPTATVIVRPFVLAVPRLVVTSTKSSTSGSVSVTTTLSAGRLPRFVTVSVYSTTVPMLAVVTLTVLVMAGSAKPGTGVSAGGADAAVGVAVGGAGVAVGVAVGGTGVAVGVAVGGTGVAVSVGVGGSAVGVNARAGAAILAGVLIGRNAITINKAPTRAVIHERVRDCIQSPCEASRRSLSHHNASKILAHIGLGSSSIPEFVKHTATE